MPRRRSAKPSLVLTERDHALLQELARMRLLTREHVIGLGFFRSASRANSRLCQLRRAGLLAVVRPPVGACPALGLYRLGEEAVSFLAPELPGGLEEADRLARVHSSLLISHTLAVADVRVVLERQGMARGWRGEAECFHRYSVRKHAGDPWRDETLRPDGFADVLLDGSWTASFLEVDLGHVSLPRIADKLARYATYQQSAVFARRYGRSSFVVLFACTGAKRLECIKKLAGCEPSLDVRFTTLHEIRSGNVRLGNTPGETA